MGVKMFAPRLTTGFENDKLNADICAKERLFVNYTDLDKHLRTNSVHENATLNDHNKPEHGVVYSDEEIEKYVTSVKSLMESAQINSQGEIILYYTVKNSGKLGPSPLIPGTEQLLIAGDVELEQTGIAKWLIIQRHNRYYYCFIHRHSFIEINYLYSGECKNIINGVEYMMRPGDIVIMEPGCTHEIKWLGENDILINILLLPAFAETVLEKTLAGGGEIAEFMISALYNRTYKSNFLFVKGTKNERIRQAINNLLCEYFDKEVVSAELLIDVYIQELFALIVRENKIHPENIVFAYRPNSLVSNLVQYVRNNCVTCTRESVAAHFKYSGSRISNILSENIGYGFVHLRNNFRLDLVERKLRTTSIPVKRIADECGFSNYTQFYKLYRSYFGRLPREEMQDEQLDTHVGKV